MIGPDTQIYEFKATCFFPARLDEGVIQDVIMAVTQALMTYGGNEVAAELREVHFAEGA